jgi:hypothetical protein
MEKNGARWRCSRGGAEVEQKCSEKWSAKEVNDKCLNKGKWNRVLERKWNENEVNLECSKRRW